MRAVVYHGQSDIRVEDVPAPVPSCGNIIIEVSCCLICGTDLKIWNVGNPKVLPPRILGHELVGRIVHIGADTTPLKIGDRVVVATTISCGHCYYCENNMGNMCPSTICVGTTYDGAFAEYFEIPLGAANHLIPVPDNVPDEAAAICEPLSCAINAHEIINVHAGESVAVIGGGPLGAIHAELAKAEGAKKVFLIGSTKARLALLKHIDGIEMIDGSASDPAQIIMEKTNGIGVDKVLVCAPVKSAFTDAFKYVRKGGAISYFASLPKGDSEIALDIRPVHYNELILAGVSDSRPAHVQKAVDYLATGAIRTDAIITDRLAIDDIIRGLQLMRERKCLKVAVYPTAEKLHMAEEKMRK